MKIAQVTMTMFSICGGIVCAETALPLSVLDPDSTSMYLSEEASARQYVFKGDLIKQDSGETVLNGSNLHTANGRIVVADGTLVLSGGTESNAPEKPLSILMNADVWFDASLPETIDFVDDGAAKVSQWRDVRETGSGTIDSPYKYTRSVSFTNLAHSAEHAPDPNGWFPVYHPHENGENAYVDFGQYSSGRMVIFRDAAGNEKSVEYLRHAFVVLGSHDGHYGFVFNPNGSTIYVPANYRELAKCELNHPFIQQATGWSTLLSGLFRVDGIVVDPVNNAKPNGSYQLLDIKTGKDGWKVDGLFSHDTIANTTDGFRQGGGRLCEIILFNKPLEEQDRIKVEAYLRHKWFAAKVSTPSYAIGENGVLSVASGNLDMSDPSALLVRSGATYNATTNGVECTASSSSSTLVKTGDGELVIGDVGPEIERIDIQDGTLRTRQGVFTSSSIPSDLRGVIEDSSFESFSDKYVGSGGFELSSSPVHGWATYGSYEKGHVAKWAADGGYFNNMGTAFPDGFYAGVLHVRGGLQTTLTLPSDGIYRLSYWCAQRPGYKGHEHRILIDGVSVAQVKAWDASGGWHKCSFRLPPLLAGDHTLSIESDLNNHKDSRTANLKVSDTIMGDVSGNIVGMVDAFHVDWVESAVGHIIVSNASFEVSAFSARGYEINPDIAGWEYVSKDESNKLVLEQIWNGRKTLRPASDGWRIANLYNQVQIGQTLVFPKAGTYTLTCAAATAVGDDIASNKGSIRFMLDEKEIGVLNPDAIMKTYGFMFEVPVDDYKARFVIAGLTAGAVVSIDDIRISGRSDCVVMQNTFAQSGWNVCEPSSDIDQGAGAVYWLPHGNSDVQASWGNTIYGADSKRVGIRNNASIWRTVTFPESGAYQLSVACIGRFYRAYDAHLADPGILTRYNGNEFSAWIAKGGVTNIIGRFGVDNRERFVTHRFLFDIPEGGDWEVGFSGLKVSERKIPGNNAYHSNGGVLDGFVIEKVLAKEVPTLSESAEITLAEGSVLALDYIGSRKVKSVRHAGRACRGEISAKTHPEFVSGVGSLYVSPRGIIINFR